jgi:hypothetical protein
VANFLSYRHLESSDPVISTCDYLHLKFLKEFEAFLYGFKLSFVLIVFQSS